MGEQTPLNKAKSLVGITKPGKSTTKLQRCLHLLIFKLCILYTGRRSQHQRQILKAKVLFLKNQNDIARRNVTGHAWLPLALSNLEI